MTLKKSLLLALGFFLFCSKILAQERMYFGQVEIGILSGRGVEQWDGNHENRTDFTLMTFNGVRISKNQVVGFTTGLDQYEEISIIPLALGWRGFIGKDDKPKLFGGVDVGGGSAILEKKNSDEWSKSWHEGGFLISPSVGVRFPAKKGSTALSFSIAYKSQQISQFSGTLSQFNTQAIDSDLLPPGFDTLTENSYIYRSLVVRAGLIF